MREKAAFAILFALFACSVLPMVSSQQANWVTVATVRDLTDNTVLSKGQSLLAGHTFNVTITINVPFSQAMSSFAVMLDKSMGLSGSQYWYIASPNYTGYDPANFSPGSRTIVFGQVQGELDLYTTFVIPQDLTISGDSGLKLHFAKQNYEIVSIIVTGGSKVGSLTLNVSDSLIENYLNTYAQKSSLLPSGKIDKAYSTIVTSILQQSQTIFSLGLPDNATNLLNIVSTDAFPAPPNTMLTTGLIAGVAGLGVLLVVVIVILLRTRTGVEYARSVIGGVQKELAGLEVTAAQYDKVLSERLRNLREKLGEAT